ncbi:hypothetical protein ACHAPT_013625 [Fusarium lateritium]
MQFYRCYTLFLSATCGLASTLVLDKGAVITFDNATQSVKVLRDHSVVIEDDTISAIIPSADSASFPPDAEIVPAKGKIISPGFIDTHRHLFRSAFKTLGSSITMATYFATLSPYIPNVINRLSADDIYYGQLIGIWESLGAGVTTIADHSYGTFDDATSEASLQASIDTGARIYWCFGLHTLPNNYTVQDQVKTFHRLLRSVDWTKTPVRPGVSFDEFTSAQEKDVDDVVALVNPSLLQSLGLINRSTPIIFAHSTGISTDDSQIRRQHDHYISIAPESEMHFGHGFPHAHKIMDKAALGIDASWAWSGDLVTQARIWLQTVRLGMYQRALDEWIVPSNSPIAPNMLGWNDPVAAIILHLNPGNVQYVLVDGQFRKRDFKMVAPENPSRSLDDAEERFLESASRLQRQFLEDPVVVL